MKRITSRQNPLVARYRAVARGEDPARLLLDGEHLVREALEADLVVQQAVVAADALGRDDIKALTAELDERRIEVVSASAPVMAAVSPVRSSSVIVAIAGRPTHVETMLYRGATPFVVIACDVQDPGNVGAIVRVAEAASATGVIAAGRSADPFGWKALRGSMGSALRLPVVRRHHVQEAVAEASRCCRIVATIPRGGRSIFDADLAQPTGVLIGGEGGGLPAPLIDAADERITIPMEAPVESLNAAVTAALIVYEARRQRTCRKGL